eukprot:scaffold332_cov117-Cylindrotheca_fusiformis.AAC.21
MLQSKPPPNSGRSTAPDPPGQLPLTIDEGTEEIGQGTPHALRSKAALPNNVTPDVRGVGIEQPATTGQSSSSANMAAASLPEKGTAASLIGTESKRASTAEHDSVTESTSKMQASQMEPPKSTSPSKTASAATHSRSTRAKPMFPNGDVLRDGSTLAHQPSPSKATKASRITEHSLNNGSASAESTALICRPDATPITFKVSKLDLLEEITLVAMKPPCNSSAVATTLPASGASKTAAKDPQPSDLLSYLHKKGNQFIFQLILNLLALIGLVSCYFFVSTWLSRGRMEE